jgi:hypothetical protein
MDQHKQYPTANDFANQLISQGTDESLADNVVEELIAGLASQGLAVSFMEPQQDGSLKQRWRLLPPNQKKGGK